MILGFLAVGINAQPHAVAQDCSVKWIQLDKLEII